MLEYLSNSARDKPVAALYWRSLRALRKILIEHLSRLAGIKIELANDPTVHENVIIFVVTAKRSPARSADNLRF